jgi:hypothetical protein
MSNFIDILEREELIQKIEEAGFGKIIDILLMNENKVYTKKGRLNKSGACRILNCKPRDLESMLQKFREIIRSDQFLEEEKD